MVVEKFPGANTVEVTGGVEEALAALQPGLRASRSTRGSSGRRPSSSRRATTYALLLGARPAAGARARRPVPAAAGATLIACSRSRLAARPPSLVLDLAGHRRSTPWCWPGWCWPLGVVVEDAVVDVENVVRRLRERRGPTTGERASRVIGALARDAAGHGVRDGDRAGRAGAAARARPAVRRLLPAAGGLVRRGGAGLDGGRADRHSGAGSAAAARGGPARASPRAPVARAGCAGVAGRPCRGRPLRGARLAVVALVGARPAVLPPLDQPRLAARVQGVRPVVRWRGRAGDLARRA